LLYFLFLFSGFLACSRPRNPTSNAIFFCIAIIDDRVVSDEPQQLHRRMSILRRTYLVAKRRCSPTTMKILASASLITLLISLLSFSSSVSAE